MKNDNRNFTIIVRVSSEEKIIIIERYKKLGYNTLSCFMRDTAIKRKLISKTDTTFIFQIKKIGVNINQITRAINSKTITPFMESGLIHELDKCNRLLQQLNEQINDSQT